MVLVIFIFFMFVTGPMVILDFLRYLFTGRSLIGGGTSTIIEGLTLLVYPILYLLVSDIGQKNDCCSESALFSPNHRLTIYTLIIISLTAYFYSGFRKALLPPLIEVAVNCILVLAVVLNVVLIIHGSEGWVIWLLGSGPIIILYLYRIIDNHDLFLASLQESENRDAKATSLFKTVLNQDLIRKIPLLLILCLPLLVLIVGILLLFGQKPDSFIQAFTDTYKHGLSQLNCNNVTCPDGHFLCTIAASGHEQFVKPIRKGVRQQISIKVNRQLLVSNAFEDLLAERLPRFHRCVRTLYNFIGGNCKKFYDVLGNKWIADVVYVLMKPLEWFFLASLYMFDRRPENRIAKQYLYSHHRQAVDAMNLN